MPDMVQMIIVRGCDADGQGGEVLDAPKIITPDGSVDQVLEAFRDAYGLHSYPNEHYDANQPESEANPTRIAVSPARNFTYRVRMYVQDIWGAWGSKQADAQAKAAALAARQQVEGQLRVKD